MQIICSASWGDRHQDSTWSTIIRRAYIKSADTPTYVVGVLEYSKHLLLTCKCRQRKHSICKTGLTSSTSGCHMHRFADGGYNWDLCTLVRFLHHRGRMLCRPPLRRAYLWFLESLLGRLLALGSHISLPEDMKYYVSIWGSVWRGNFYSHGVERLRQDYDILLFDLVWIPIGSLEVECHSWLELVA